MKKLFSILLLSTIFLTGCSIEKINGKEIDYIIDKTIIKNNNLKNTNFDGYSYYVPREMYFLNKNNYNTILKDEHNNYYYVYVDAVSYYHKIVKNYKENKNIYYSRKLTNKKKFGYFEIKEQKNTYYIEAMYNYTKVEALVRKKDLEDAVLNIGMILSSVNYNDKVLSTIVGDNALDYKEETYNIFETKKDTSNFLNYINEYDKIDEEDTDEDSLKIEEEE